MEEVGRYLSSQSFVSSFRRGEPGEGGDGVTIAFLGESSEARTGR
jgi:dsDNA-specific endonuclease/ATPase MutS2